MLIIFNKDCSFAFPSVAPKDKGSNRKQRRVGDVTSHIQKHKTQIKKKNNTEDLLQFPKAQYAQKMFFIRLYTSCF